MTQRNWHTQAKEMPQSTEGHCPYCHKTVQNLEAHIHSDHKGEKPAKK